MNCGYPASYYRSPPEKDASHPRTGRALKSGRLHAVAQCFRALERKLRQRDRSAEQIALPELTAGSAQELKLLRGFHAFRRGLDVETAPEAGDRAHDRRAVGMRGHALDERLVDLDLVEREHLQIAHRRVADPEIVEDDRDAEVLDLVQDGKVLLALLDQHGLSDFELEPPRIEARLFQRRLDHLHEVAL